MNCVVINVTVARVWQYCHHFLKQQLPYIILQLALAADTRPRRVSSTLAN